MPVLPLPIRRPGSGGWRSAALGLAAVLVPLAAQGAGVAANAAQGAITIERPWSRATPGGAKVAAGYLVIRNAGDTPDRLTGVKSDVAGHVAPHHMSMDGGVMVMRPLPDGLTVPAHGAVTLSPGGDHLMLEALRHPLRKGETFPATLTFEKAGDVAVTFSVEAVGAQGPGGAASR